MNKKNSANELKKVKFFGSYELFFGTFFNYIFLRSFELFLKVIWTMMYTLNEQKKLKWARNKLEFEQLFVSSILKWMHVQICSIVQTNN